MVDGLVYTVGLMVLAILAATHWFDSYLQHWGNIKRVRMKCVLFIILLLLSQMVNLTLRDGYSVNLSGMIIPAIVCLILLWRFPAGQMWQIGAVILFLALIYGGSYQLMLMDPILMIIPPHYFYPILYTLFTLPITKDLPSLWLLTAGGMIGGELFHQSFLSNQGHLVQVGGSGFRDQLFMALVLVTVSSLTWGYLVKVRKVIRRSFVQKGKTLS